MKPFILHVVLLLAFFSCTSQAQTTLKTRTVATGLDTPWEIIWGPDNHIWVSERYGRISRINPTTGVITPLLTIADAVENGEGGLLGMVLDTIIRNNLSDVFVAYNYNSNTGYKEKIVKYQYNGTTLINPVIILDNINAASIHNGCRLMISPDRKLFITVGDAATTSTSQNLSSINGKTLRINLDGTIPTDNPINNSPIWSWGHRNAQGLVYAPLHNLMYSSEHGQNIEDELNIIQKARNYGWVNVEGACNLTSEQAFCRDSNVVEPIAGWSPTLGVAGIDFYNSNLLPDWKNSILMTSLKGSRLTVIKLSNDGLKAVSKTDFFNGTYGRLRDVCISPDGKVYIAVSNKDTRGTPRSDDDKIVEISPFTSSTQEIKGSMEIFPNPVREVLNIKTELNIGHIDISDSMGRIVLKNKAANTLHVAALTEGVYFLNIYDVDNQLVAVEKFVKL
jgi:glucose/arabinose dehydrogenase